LVKHLHTASQQISNKKRSLRSKKQSNKKVDGLLSSEGS
jgi:hypothetical protein